MVVIVDVSCAVYVYVDVAKMWQKWPLASARRSVRLLRFRDEEQACRVGVDTRSKV